MKTFHIQDINMEAVWDFEKAVHEGYISLCKNARSSYHIFWWKKAREI